MQGQSLAGKALILPQELAAWLRSPSSGRSSTLQRCWHKVQLLLCCAGQTLPSKALMSPQELAALFKSPSSGHSSIPKLWFSCFSSMQDTYSAIWVLVEIFRQNNIYKRYIMRVSAGQTLEGIQASYCGGGTKFSCSSAKTDMPYSSTFWICIYTK